MLNQKKLSIRSETGSLASVLMSILFLIAFIIGALSVDMGHIQLATEQLQNATDAAALAGGNDLWTSPDTAEQSARAVCAMNIADAKSVSSSTPGVTVDVAVVPPTNNTPGTVEVSHICSLIFGRSSDVINVRSVAGTAGTLDQLFFGQAFPLAVSIDAVPNGGSALQEHKIGETVTFYINSQQVKNAAFTSFTVKSANANYIGDAIEQALGLAPTEPGFIPSVTIGDDIYLSNGVLGRKILARQPNMDAFLNSGPFVLPVISGDPAYNQTREVIGFIGFKPTGVSFGNGHGIVETLTGELVFVQVRGISGAGSGLMPGALASSALGPIQLIQ